MRLLFAFVFIAISIQMFGQDGEKKFYQSTSKPFTPKVKPLDKSTVSFYVRQYVVREFSSWVKKGEFEPMAEYKNRVSINNQEKERSKFVTAAMEELVARELAATSSRVTVDGDYDEPKGGFLLRHQKWGSFLLKVPIFEGREFKSNKDYLQIKDIKLGVKNDVLVMQACTVHSPRFEKEYPYNLLDNQVLDKTSDPRIDFIDPANLPDTKSEVVQNIAKPLPEWNFESYGKGTDSILAVVIGNSKYEYAPQIPAAINNAHIVMDMLTKAFGIFSTNILSAEDCDKEMLDEIFGVKGDARHSKIQKMINPKIKEIWVYYCGHGSPPYESDRALTPEEKNQTFLIGRETPVSSLFSRAYSLNDMYKSLGQMPVAKVNVFLDVCFSGRELKREGENFAFQQAGDIQTDSKLLVFTAGTNSEVALMDSDRQYGLFTKVMVQCIQKPESLDVNGDRAVTYWEWFNGILHHRTGVPALAKLKGASQNPTIQGEERKNEVFLRY